MLRTLKYPKTLTTPATSIRRAKSVLMEFKSGQMKQSMKVNGIIIRPMAKASCGVRTETHMKETGEMIKQTDLGTLSPKMVRSDT